MICILETPINVFPSNGQVCHKDDDFSFRFNGDKLLGSIGRMYDIDRDVEIDSWWCKHNINATNNDTCFTHPHKNTLEIGKSYKYRYEIFQKNPNIPDSSEQTPVETFSYNSSYPSKLVSGSSTQAKLPTKWFDNINSRLAFCENVTIKIYGTQQGSPEYTINILRYITETENNVDKTYLVAEFKNTGTRDYVLSHMEDQHLNKYQIYLNAYSLLADIYMACGSTTQLNKNNGRQIESRVALNNIRKPIYQTIEGRLSMVGCMYIEIGNERRKIIDYQEVAGTEQHDGIYILTYDTPFSSGLYDKYKNSKGEISFRIYSNYIVTQWYDFKYRTKPTVKDLSAVPTNNGLECSMTYSQPENVTMKNYQYDIYAGNSLNEYDIDIDNNPVTISEASYAEIGTSYQIKLDLPMSIGNIGYDVNLGGWITAYHGDYIIGGTKQKIRSYVYSENQENPTNQVIINVGNFDYESVYSNNKYITKIEIELKNGLLFSSGKRYSYNTTFDFPIPTKTTDYRITSTVTTQENDTYTSGDLLYSIKPDKYVEEFIVDTEVDISSLPKLLNDYSEYSTSTYNNVSVNVSSDEYWDLYHKIYIEYSSNTSLPITINNTVIDLYSNKYSYEDVDKVAYSVGYGISADGSFPLANPLTENIRIYQADLTGISQGRVLKLTPNVDIEQYSAYSSICRYAFYDSSDNYLNDTSVEYINTEPIEITVPENAQCIRFVYVEDSSDKSDMLQLKSENEIGKINSRPITISNYIRTGNTHRMILKGQSVRSDYFGTSDVINKFVLTYPSSQEYCAVGSMAYVVETGNTYILTSDKTQGEHGWILTSTSISENEEENEI